MATKLAWIVVALAALPASVALLLNKLPSQQRVAASLASMAGDYDPFHPSFPTMTTNRLNQPWVQQRVRPRRNRKSEAIRGLVRENIVTPRDFIYPLFIQEGDRQDTISSMPGCLRHSLSHMVQEIDDAVRYGIKAFILFPMISDRLKSPRGEEAYNPSGLVPRAISAIKSKHPDVLVFTDIALDPYSSEGHDGIVHNQRILNDETIVQLQRQALMHADAGADFVAPSDMMDGRIGALRDALDSVGHTDVGMMAYTAKYASAFYGPFRDALHSHPGFGDKQTYQQDPANAREALLEASLDVLQGADILLVKPGLPYLDVVHRLREATSLPLGAYQVSGEYAMIKAAAEKGWLDEKRVVMETLLAFKRAGCDVVVTYFAKQAARWLAEEA